MELNRIIKAKNKEFEITNPNEPFKDDKLGRKECAEVLTSVVESYGNGAVIALNGAWGTGKTTFLKMWAKHMENHGFPVIYYNAWEDDICEEPLMSMLRGLKTLKKEEGLDKVFRTGAKVLVGALAGAVTAATGVFGEIAKGAVEGGMKQMEDSIYESLKEEDDRMELMRDFKESLTNYMTTVCNNGKPLVYLVDELDRCNPSFAVKVLERIKHLFDVPNVVFVLSIDKEQLVCSVKGFYGSNEINADEYLRRFIDIEYNLPEADVELFCEYLYDYYDFERFIRNEWRLRNDYFADFSYKADEDKRLILYMAISIARLKHLSLRQIERIFAISRIGLCSMPIKSEILPQLFFLLSYLKTCETELFDRIASYSMDLQKFVDAMEELIASGIMDEDASHYLMAMALSCYHIGYSEHLKAKGQIIILKGKDSKLTVSFHKFDETTIEKDLKACYINNQSYNMSFIIRRLKLLERLTN
jgi:hypothetical protein